MRLDQCQRVSVHTRAGVRTGTEYRAHVLLYDLISSPLPVNLYPLQATNGWRLTVAQTRVRQALRTSARARSANAPSRMPSVKASMRPPAKRPVCVARGRINARRERSTLALVQTASVQLAQHVLASRVPHCRACVVRGP